jgi:dTDP-glucose 4,6-dehydratase
VTDVVRANLLAMDMQKVGKGEVINIGGSKEYSVNDIAKMIGGETVTIETRIEPKRTLPDTSRALELLGWQSEISLENGVAELKKSFNV